MVEHYFLYGMTKTEKHVQEAKDFLDSDPLVVAEDFDQKNKAEQLDTMNPAMFLNDEVKMIMAALSFDKDDDPDLNKTKKFEIDFAEKWYIWLNKRIQKFQNVSGIKVMANMQNDVEMKDASLQVESTAIDHTLQNHISALTV